MRCHQKEMVFINQSLTAILHVIILSPALAFLSCPSQVKPRRPLSQYRVKYLQTSNQDNESSEYLATCIPGLAPYLEEELISCGAIDTTQLSNAAVSFATNDEAVALKALLHVRTAHRLLEKIDSFFDVESRNDVYDSVQQSKMHIKDLLGDGKCSGGSHCRMEWI